MSTPINTLLDLLDEEERLVYRLGIVHLSDTEAGDRTALRDELQTVRGKLRHATANVRAWMARGSVAPQKPDLTEALESTARDATDAHDAAAERVEWIVERLRGIQGEGDEHSRSGAAAYYEREIQKLIAELED
jgi:hypothetical protein